MCRPYVGGAVGGPGIIDLSASNVHAEYMYLSSGTGLAPQPGNRATGAPLVTQATSGKHTMGAQHFIETNRELYEVEMPATGPLYRLIDHPAARGRGACKLKAATARSERQQRPWPRGDAQRPVRRRAAHSSGRRMRASRSRSTSPRRGNAPRGRRGHSRRRPVRTCRSRQQGAATATAGGAGCSRSHCCRTSALFHRNTARC